MSDRDNMDMTRLAGMYFGKKRDDGTVIKGDVEHAYIVLPMITMLHDGSLSVMNGYQEFRQAYAADIMHDGKVVANTTGRKKRKRW